FHQVGVIRVEARGEPALRRGLHQWRQAIGANLVTAGCPALGGADLWRRGAHDGPAGPVAGTGAKPRAPQAPERQAAEVGAFDLKRAEQPQHVAAQVGERVGGGRGGRLPVATAVVAQYAEGVRQCVGLCVPHVQVGAQRVGEHQPRAALAVDAVVQAVGGQMQERHVPPPQTRSTASATPIPTPTHSVASPRRPPVFSSWWTRVSASRAPLMPSGWPSAIAPPCALTWGESSGTPSERSTASDWLAKASLSSIASKSPISSPSRASSLPVDC